MSNWDADEMLVIARARNRQRELDRAAAKSGRALGAAAMTAPKTFRCAVVGDAEVGKTSLCDRWAGKDFQEDYTPTADASSARAGTPKSFGRPRPRTGHAALSRRRARPHACNAPAAMRRGDDAVRPTIPGSIPSQHSPRSRTHASSSHSSEPGSPLPFAG